LTGRGDPRVLVVWRPAGLASASPWLTAAPIALVDETPVGAVEASPVAIAVPIAATAETPAGVAVPFAVGSRCVV
jgi:hypothetical protein